MRVYGIPIIHIYYVGILIGIYMRVTALQNEPLTTTSIAHHNAYRYKCVYLLGKTKLNFFNKIATIRVFVYNCVLYVLACGVESERVERVRMCVLDAYGRKLRVRFVISYIYVYIYSQTRNGTFAYKTYHIS